MHSYSKEETIIHGIAIAINDLILDATEDAAVDFKDDVDPDTNEQKGDNQDKQLALKSPKHQRTPQPQLEDKILDAVITMLRARRSMASDWQTMRDIFSREQFIL
jgi:hypothetical protein